jgi:hypothetical protein
MRFDVITLFPGCLLPVLTEAVSRAAHFAPLAWWMSSSGTRVISPMAATAELDDRALAVALAWSCWQSRFALCLERILADRRTHLESHVLNARDAWVHFAGCTHMCRSCCSRLWAGLKPPGVQKPGLPTVVQCWFAVAMKAGPAFVAKAPMLTKRVSLGDFLLLSGWWELRHGAA